MQTGNCLLLDLYELTMAEAYLARRRGVYATFDLFVRELPRNRSYLVASGLEDILGHIRNLKFSKEDLAYLKGLRMFSDGFLEYLKDFRFNGDIWALPEGTVFFAQEPVVRVTAPIIEAQIIESFFLNTVNLASTIASKASRVVLAAEGRNVFDFSLRRTHGSEAGVKVARSSYIAGCAGTSTVLAGKLYDIPVAGTMAHSFIMSFKREIDAFLAYSDTFPSGTILLVDTYDTRSGIRNAIKAGLHLENKGFRLQGIRLDSGDMVSLSRYARAALRQAGLGYVKIFASGNLDEFKIRELLKNGAQIDSFGVGTNMGTSIDAPCLDVVYKMCEVTAPGKKFTPVMKLSKGKLSYPGRKQVFRIKDKNGRFVRDIIGLENEDIDGDALLVKAVQRGKITYKSPALKQIRELLAGNLHRFPKTLLEPGNMKYEYPVLISPKLRKLKEALSTQLRQGR